MKPHELMATDGLDGVGNAIQVGKLYQDHVVGQFLDDGSDLTFGQLHFRHIVQRGCYVKQFHRNIQSQNTSEKGFHRRYTTRRYGFSRIFPREQYPYSEDAFDYLTNITRGSRARRRLSAPSAPVTCQDTTSVISSSTTALKASLASCR